MGVKLNPLDYNNSPTVSGIPENVESSHLAYQEGTLETILVTYTDWPEEEVINNHLAYLDGSLYGGVKEYSVPEEEVGSEHLAYFDGTLELKLITYLNWVPEEVEASHVSYTGGTLS